jgi:hypothetical protein
MERPEREVHVETDQARGGSTPNVVRWVLGISLLLAIIAMTLVWIIPALSKSDAQISRTGGETAYNGQDSGGSVLAENETWRI